MGRTIYRTATSLNGYIADDRGSLDWLFAVDQGSSDAGHVAFLSRVTVLVEGSSTYEWILRETDVLATPGRWQEFYGTRPTFVLTTRDLPVPPGADVRFRSGAVTAHLPEIRAAAGPGDTWVVGGGDLAGQFLDVGALDEIVLTVAPVALPSGAPLLPRRIDATRLQLSSATHRGPFAELVYDVAPSGDQIQ